MTGKQLKAFRAQFSMTVPQAAGLLKVATKKWYGMEQGGLKISDHFATRVGMWTTKLISKLIRRTHWCRYCRKNVRKAWEHKVTLCPYCSKRMNQSMNKRIREVLPIIKM